MDINNIRDDYSTMKSFEDCTTLEEKKERAKLNMYYWMYVEDDTESVEYWRGVIKGIETAEDLMDTWIYD